MFTRVYKMFKVFPKLFIIQENVFRGLQRNIHRFEKIFLGFQKMFKFFVEIVHGQRRNIFRGLQKLFDGPRFFFGVSIIIQGFSKKKFIVHESIFNRSQKCSPVRENVLGV
jgi:hypothetical protein